MSARYGAAQVNGMATPDNIDLLWGLRDMIERLIFR